MGTVAIVDVVVAAFALFVSHVFGRRRNAGPPGRRLRSGKGGAASREWGWLTAPCCFRARSRSLSRSLALSLPRSLALSLSRSLAPSLARLLARLALALARSQSRSRYRSRSPRSGRPTKRATRWPACQTLQAIRTACSSPFPLGGPPQFTGRATTSLSVASLT